ncbi:MAG: rhomboid family intramembrane serine protease [Bacillaceae bacterium]|nr:rhomboid family intramembrane serine protease [Bacillaceae bacterium]
MVIQEEYYFWKLAAHFMIQHGFDLIQVDEKNRELWLEKVQGRHTHIIRLYHHTFDWANHLKRDIAFVIERVKRIKRMLVGKNITIHNVYIATFPPVDSWEQLKNNVQVKDQKNFLIKSYYLDEENRQKESDRLFHNMNLDEPVIPVPLDEGELESQIQYLKQQMIFKHEQHKREAASIFNHGKPLVTYVLLAINILLFLVMENTGGSTNSLNLIQWGAKYNPYILEGEWWRIFSSMFLHIGFLHIFMNMLALYYLGNAVERMYGSIKFSIIYLLAGLFGGLASFATNASVAAGASGALFGLFGALLFFGVMNRKLFFRTMGKNLLFIIGLNIILGISVPQIDNGAHMGGLVGGFIASAIIQLPKNKTPVIQGTSLLVYTGMIGILLYYGVHQTFVQYDARTHGVIANEYINQEQYDQAIDITTFVLNKNPSEAEILYFFRSLAYIKDNSINPAINDLNKAVQLKPSFHEAHYNLAILYKEREQDDLAYDHAKRAVELNPGSGQYQDLLEELSIERNLLP